MLLALLLAAAPASVLSTASRLEPIGWSADGRRVALRVFHGSDWYENEPCEGYLDAAGKPFRTGLALVVLEDGVVTQELPIQDVPTANPEAPTCTPPGVAKARLEKAKEALTAAGIDRAQPGAALVPKLAAGKRAVKKKAREDGDLVISTWRDVWTAGDFRLTLELKSVCEEMVCNLTGGGSWALTQPGHSARSGKLKLEPVEYGLQGNGSYAWQLTAVFTSPGGDVVLPFLSGVRDHMRGGSSETRLLGLQNASRKLK